MGISGQLFLKVQNSNPIERWLELSISLEQESRIVIIIKSGHHPHQFHPVHPKTLPGSQNRNVQNYLRLAHSVEQGHSQIVVGDGQLRQDQLPVDRVAIGNQSP